MNYQMEIKSLRAEVTALKNLMVCVGRASGITKEKAGAIVEALKKDFENNEWDNEFKIEVISLLDSYVEHWID